MSESAPISNTGGGESIQKGKCENLIAFTFAFFSPLFFAS